MSDDEVTPAGRLTSAVIPPVDSATVLLLRDGAGGLEVLLLERHEAADFAGGALVFPGGKVAPTDAALAPERWRGADLASWRERMGATDEAAALGLLVAAVRETFEEVGVLLATREDGTPVTGTDLAREPLRAARRRLTARDEAYDWTPVLADEGLVLDLGALVLWSWWVTPEGQHKRFDTRFLAACLPRSQQATADGVEAVSVRWSRPDEALAAHARGDALVIYPTRRNLAALAPFGSVADVWDASATDRLDRRRIQPTLVRVEGRTMLQHPDGGEPEPI